MRSRIIPIIAMILALLPFQTSAQSFPDTLRIGKSSQDYPPYHWTEAGRVVGLVPDMLRATALRMGIGKVKFEIRPWNRMLKMSEAGDLDAVMPLYNTPKRRTFLDFPDEPVAYELLGFFTLDSNTVDYDGNLESLLSYRIGTISGYSYGSRFDALDFDRIDIEDEQSLFRMLKAGRYQVGISDVRVLEYYSKIVDFKPSVLTPYVSREPLYVGFSKKKNFGNLVSKFSKTLAEFRSSEEYIELLDKYDITPMTTK